MTDNELLSVTEVEIFTFGGDTPNFAPGDVTVEPVDPVTLLVIPVDEVLPPILEPDYPQMMWVSDGGAMMPANPGVTEAMMDEAFLAVFHLVPYDAMIYG